MEQRRQRVLVETNKHRITGVVTMPAGGFRSRLSDFLNQSEREFIALTDAVVAPLTGNGPLEPRDFVVVGRSHIVLAMPENGGAGDAEAN